MKLTVLAVSLALACAFTSAEARHVRSAGCQSVDIFGNGCLGRKATKSEFSARMTTGCSDPVMKPCDTGGAASRGRGRVSAGREMVQVRGRKVQVAARTLSRPRAWCGWWLGRHLGMLDRKLWLARNWAHVGRPAHGPHVGAVVVWARGRRSGHVGIITGKTDRGWVVKSGNDGHAVRERVRSVSNAIAFRWP